MNNIISSPLVSIIIPAYNAEKYIEETLQSAINQTYKHIEIVVVDDGSTDSTLKIAKKFEGSFVKIISVQNGGAAKARNIGFRNSKGDYIQFLDADDLMKEDKIEVQMKVLLSNQNCIIGCSWIKFIDELGNTFGGVGPYISIRKNMSPLAWLQEKHMMAQHAWLTPRNLILEAGGWDETLSCNDDGEFFWRVIAKSKQVLFENTSIVYYRVSATHTGVSAMNGYSKFASLYNSAISYKKIIYSLDSSIQSKISIGNFFRRIAFDYYYPLYPELYQNCIKQSEFKYGNYKPLVTGKTKWLSLFLGWKIARKIQQLTLKQPKYLPNNE
jgi:glycosyltransferase involved in cell wall biosynthesis